MRLASLVAVGVFAACTTSPASPGLSAARLVEGESGREVTLAEALDALAGADAVFFGETHLDESTHRLELEVYEGLVERTGGRVILAMEMFSRRAQPVLDAYLAGEIDEAELLERAEPWGNYHTGYRALVERARELGLPVVGSNVHAALRRKVSRGGREALEGLSEEERGWLAPEIFPNSRAYWERFARIVRAPAGQTTDPADYLWSGQSLWDNAMGHSCAEALRARPGWLVYHVNGRFHTDYGQGTVDQFLKRSPGARAMTITATPVRDLLAFGGAEPSEVADYVAFVQDRARGKQDGLLAVRAGRDVRYQLHVPEGALHGEPLPLLVWLGDGMRAEDLAVYWEIAFRDEALVATLEPLYREVEEDLSVGGRWVWPETLSSDVSNGIGAATEVIRYVSDYYPVDPERVVLAGEGTGATVAAAAALFGGVERALALDPLDFRRLRLHGLPEPGGDARRLILGTGDRDSEWWETEVSDYAASGLEADLDRWMPFFRDVEGVLREELGLQPLPWVGAEWTSGGGSFPYWWQVQARAAEAGLVNAPLDPTLLASGETSGRLIPVPPGPFGGTTVLVVLAEGEAQQAAWRALDGSDVLNAHGPMHRLRVAMLHGEPSVDSVLAELHRNNVLIVPATDWADSQTMRRIRDAGAFHLDRMTVTFQPGLGLRRHLGNDGGL